MNMINPQNCLLFVCLIEWFFEDLEEVQPSLEPSISWGPEWRVCRSLALGSAASSSSTTTQCNTNSSASAFDKRISLLWGEGIELKAPKQLAIFALRWIQVATVNQNAIKVAEGSQIAPKLKHDRFFCQSPVLRGKEREGKGIEAPKLGYSCMKLDLSCKGCPNCDNKKVAQGTQIAPQGPKFGNHL